MAHNRYVYTRIVIVWIGPKTTIVMTTVIIAITLTLVIGGLPANNMNIQAKKHSECFKAGQSDGADHPFDAPRSIVAGRSIKMDF
ncbi:MAG TPA: hypothetical protein VH796_17980 [Nitrososphaeraceae archaeon]